MKKPARPPDGIPPHVRQTLVAFWESIETGLSVHALDTLGSFYVPMQTVHLQPPLADQIVRCQNAIPWEPIRRIILVDHYPGHDVVRRTIKQSLHAHFRPLYKKYATRGEDGKSNPDAGLSVLLRGNILETIHDAIRISFQFTAWTKLEHDHFYAQLLASACYALTFRYFRVSEVDLQPLLALWCSGRFPIGFNGRGDLVLICKTKHRVIRSLNQ